MASAVLTSPAIAQDPRVAAFCAPAAREVFHSICHAKEICVPDRFDVPSIHREARDVFEAMIARATTPPGTFAGRSLLLLGESGSGKTHLLRAFRASVHSAGLGYCGYMQMTTPTGNYGRYILAKLLSSLDERYDDPREQLSGLMCLSNALAASLGPDYESIMDGLRDGIHDGEELHEHVDRLATDVVQDLDAAGTPLKDVVRALFYMQRHETALRAAAHSYLRCENLSRMDRERLGDMPPRTDDDQPLSMIAALGRLMWAVHRRPLVLFVDQLEEMYNLENAKELFRRAMGALNTIAESVPSSVIVIACLQDFYDQLRSSLAQSLLDRFEDDPGKVLLETSRTAEEIGELVACRLEVLYDDAGVAIDRADRTFPIPIERLRECHHQRTRDVLRWCGKFQDEYRRSGEPPESPPLEQTPAPPDPALDLSEAWQVFQAEHQGLVPAVEAWRAQILATAVARTNEELPAGGPMFEASVEGRFIALEKHAADNSVQKTLVAVCDRLPHGGGLARQVEELEKAAGENGRFIVRSMEFPSNPATKIAKLLGDYLMRGGRRAVIEDAHWRQMLAWEAFRKLHHDRAGFAIWLRTEQPLTHIKPLGELLEVHRAVQPPEPPAAPSGDRSSSLGETPSAGACALPPAEPAIAYSTPLRLGARAGLDPAPIEMPADDLTRHAAFLGGSGSGKTTVALNVVEQLLARGVSAVLIDRKGDLCGYADTAWWAAPAEDAAATARKRALRNTIDVALFTPGAPRGRPLRLSIVPPGISESKDFEQLAQAAASAVASMIQLDSEARHGPQRAILLQAVRQLALLRPNRESGVEELVELLASNDPSLINAIGKLEPKHFKKIIEGLETLRISRGELLDASAERLDFDRLVGPTSAGQARLTVISTKFLGDLTGVRFWVAQFLNELRRWASKKPASSLQLVCLLDEADIYLPATSQPPTKPPLEDLLKRGRSSGIGLLLATQSPGDLDYKCRENIRSWFLGRIKETTALAKLKPLLASAPFDVSAKLAGQTTGEFQWLRDGAVSSLRAAASLMTTEQRSEDEIRGLATVK